VSILSKSSILVTGGTGSFGKAFIEYALNNLDPKRIVIFSRDELKQYEARQKFNDDSRLRWFIGDIRDQHRLIRAMHNIDYVIHAAALKQVDTAEYNPFEYVQTNIIGTQNVIEAAIDTGVKKVIALSTDKASAPVNLYGATKLCSDKLFVAANNISGDSQISFSVVRYGNVFGSRGSVVPFFLKQRENGVLPITSPEMTRFNITLEEGVDMVLWVIENSVGGEIFVPKIPSYRLMDLATAIGPDCEYQFVGIRPGEKLHEEMVSSSDSINTVTLDKYYAILPNLKEPKFKKFIESFSGAQVSPGFSYSSDKNGKFLTVDELREMIKKFIDSEFK